MNTNEIIIATPDQMKNVVREEMNNCIQPLLNLLLKFSRPTSPEKLNANQALSLLAENGLPTTTGNLYKMTAKCEIPCARIGKRLIFSRTDLLNWIESRSIRKTDSIEKSLMAVSKSARNHNNMNHRIR